MYKAPELRDELRALKKKIAQYGEDYVFYEYREAKQMYCDTTAGSSQWRIESPEIPRTLENLIEIGRLSLEEIVGYELMSMEDVEKEMGYKSPCSDEDESEK